jgi:hypothetical protein
MRFVKYFPSGVFLLGDDDAACMFPLIPRVWCDCHPGLGLVFAKEPRSGKIIVISFVFTSFLLQSRPLVC